MFGVDSLPLVQDSTQLDQTKSRCLNWNQSSKELVRCCIALHQECPTDRQPYILQNQSHPLKVFLEPKEAQITILAL